MEPKKPTAGQLVFGNDGWWDHGVALHALSGFVYNIMHLLHTTSNDQ